MAKLQDIKTPLLQFEEGDAPTTPASGVVKIYAKADGLLYSKDDAGTETSLGSVAEVFTSTAHGTTDHTGITGCGPGTLTKAISFYIDGDLTVEAGAMSVIAPIALTITEIRIAVDTAPTGAAILLDLNKNGTTMYTTQGNRPTIAIDGTSATATDPDVTSIAVGDKISIDIDQVGSTVAGANLSVTVICEVA